MYRELAKYYDKIYYWKDYKTESQKLRRLIQKYKRSAGRKMLDVACGTGSHIRYLKRHYNITGVDLNREMLKIAKSKLPKTHFIQGDMRKFRLNETFDVIVCLFAAIAYMPTISDLQKAIQNFYAHLRPGSVVIIEPFISPDRYRKNFLEAIFINNPDLKMTRMALSKRKGSIFIFDRHFLIMTKSGVKYANEIDYVKMYTVEQYLHCMRNAGLKAKFLKNGLMKDRGLYIGTKK
jgi:ubiquinone/menaquinone biosynthesis C-methylase UbiE